MREYEDEDFELEDVRPRKGLKNMKKFKTNDSNDKEYTKRERERQREAKTKRQFAD